MGISKKRRAEKQRISKLRIAETTEVNHFLVAYRSKFPGINWSLDSRAAYEKLLGITVTLGDPYSSPRWRSFRIAALLAARFGVAPPRILWDTKQKLLISTPAGELRSAICAYEVLDVPESSDEPSAPPNVKRKSAVDDNIMDTGGKLNTPEKVDKVKKFYRSYGWRKLRYEVLKFWGGKCQACKNSERVLHVDHIKPIKKYWKLRLDPDNLQVLCDLCNHGKGNWDETDWRPECEELPATMAFAGMRERLPSGVWVRKVVPPGTRTIH